MQAGRLNIVIDAFWGSSGKGKVCDWLAATHSATDVISGNMPNAGHTVVRGDQKLVMKVLPSAAPFNLGTKVWLAPSTGFFHERLEEERQWVNGRIIELHERAFNVREEDAETERAKLSGISSTMQGSGAALCAKIMRGRKQLIERKGLINVNIVDARRWRVSLLEHITKGNALYEISQGWGLSIDHGTQYPYCTSRNCSVASAIDATSCPPSLVGDVVAVVRPYPIRVGNTEDGYSGDWMPDCTEVTWDHVKEVSGLTEEIATKERTTVTKRIRRVSTFSFELLNDCVLHNGVNKIFLNFGQYINSECAGKRGKITDAPRDVRIFVDAIERSTNTKVIGVGTGADTFDVLEA